MPDTDLLDLPETLTDIRIPTRLTWQTEGREAARNFVPIARNPYLPGSEPAGAWLCGYLEGWDLPECPFPPARLQAGAQTELADVA